jgi:hypothetical protein
MPARRIVALADPGHELEGQPVVARHTRGPRGGFAAPAQIQVDLLSRCFGRGLGHIALAGFRGPNRHPRVRPAQGVFTDPHSVPIRIWLPVSTRIAVLDLTPRERHRSIFVEESIEGLLYCNGTDNQRVDFSRDYTNLVRGEVCRCGQLIWWSVRFYSRHRRCLHLERSSPSRHLSQRDDFQT